MYEVDNTLAKGLKTLLTYEDGSIPEIFGSTFTASSNPLLDFVDYHSQFDDSSGISDHNINIQDLHVRTDSAEYSTKSGSNETEVVSGMLSNSHFGESEDYKVETDHLSRNAVTDRKVTPKIYNSPDFINLKPNGDSTYVDRSNRSEFVELFVNWALYGSCQCLVDAYISGIKILVTGRAISLCVHAEV